MKADLALHSSPRRHRHSLRLLLALTGGILAILSSGCYGPARGPTDPKEFIVQGKQWTNLPPSNPPAADPTAPTPTP